MGVLLVRRFFLRLIPFSRFQPYYSSQVTPDKKIDQQKLEKGRLEAELSA